MPLCAAVVRPRLFAVLVALLPVSARGETLPQVAFVIDAEDAPELGPRVRRALLSAVELDGRLVAKTIDLGFSEAADPLGPADAALAEAQARFHDTDLPAAQAAATRAAELYEAHLASLVTRETGLAPLRDAHIALAQVRYFSSDEDGAKAALRRAFAVDPKLDFSLALFPQAMRRLVVEARLLAETLGVGAVEVHSDPSGAEILVDGKPTGARSPATIETSVGPHSVAARFPGRVTTSQLVEVGDKGLRIAVALPRATGASAEARMLTTALPDTADARGCMALAAQLGVDGLALVHVGAFGEGFQVVGIAYVRGPGRSHGALGERVDRSGQRLSIEGQVESFGRTLLDDFVDRHSAQPTRVVSMGPWQRFRSSKAFWWVAGGVAGAVAATAIGLGVGLGEAHRQDRANQAVLLGGR